MASILTIGVVGAGVFGGYHAAKCAAHPRVRLTGISDNSLTRAHSAANGHGTSGMTLDALCAASDAVIVASVASSHADVTLQAISAGCHVLVEKPLAHTAELGVQIVQAADRAGVVLQVGHQERFVAGAIGLHTISETPTRIESWRETPMGNRGHDVSATLDLMIHDIDLVCWLQDAAPQSISGWSQPDRARAEITFASTDVTLHASRIADEARRALRLDYPSGRVEVDFGMHNLRNETQFDLDENFAEQPNAKDSLAAGLDAFVSSILDGTPVAISGLDGLRALRVAEAVDKLPRRV